MTKSLPPEHPFATVIRTLGKGPQSSRSLSQEEAEAAMGAILDDAVQPMQLGAFLMLLRVKGETGEEMAGFARAARARLQRPHQPLAVDLDWPSYAGKKRRLPWYLLAAKLLSQQGYRILMHGSSVHTPGRLYAETVLDLLDLPRCNSWEEAGRALDQHHFAYLPLEVLSPRMEALINLRPVLGLRSPIHTLARLLNPANAPASLHGIFHPGYLQVHLAAAETLGEQMLVVKGDGGEAEFMPDTVCKLRTSGLPLPSEITLGPWMERQGRKGLVMPEAEQLMRVWEGDLEDRYAESAVIGTTGLALLAMNQHDKPQAAFDEAARLWARRPVPA
ncbi:glycosyl transferase family protein [Alkalilimnicola ehrlichii MLHE-1]|uniref:Glycosyl transferase, family 3 n=1 Tax=Alkalilimnicola ehrlichii (strain ATCC BAA-1101 / DSM 17681 / MLHE-1) TaxID=187272 RepID=Q0A826_ALKEH|nr:glycosyl transferase family protein [Alkalilimnicola ehrlichii]ABI57011.1 glycosyl transferase, family 3 [Alkalilimnicola ehrlichii MLHE-1]